MSPPSPFTSEHPVPGLVVHQPRRGYRYTLDSFLLAGFVLEVPWQGPFLDAGTGSGIIALLLGAVGCQGTGLDQQAAWIELARRSARDSGSSIEFLEGDIRTFRRGGYGLGLANPPYFRQGEGSRSRDALRAAGRHELHGGLEDFVAGLASNSPRVALVLRVEREKEALRALESHARPLRRRVRWADGLVLLDAGAAPQPPEDVALEVRDAEGRVHPRIRSWYEALGARPPVDAVQRRA